MDEGAERQLAALADAAALLGAEQIPWWLFGGWAVDFHAGTVTRAHTDVDLLVWLADVPRIAKLLHESGWAHAPEEDEDGGTGYERDGVRLEPTFLERAGDEAPFIPLRHGRAALPEGALGDDVRRLGGVTARVMAREALRASKAGARDGDPEDGAKDRADLSVLDRLGPRSRARDPDRPT